MRGLKLIRVFLLAGLFAGLTGCISGRVVTNYYKRVQTGDGILLVAVDTQVPISYLLLKRTDKALTVTEVSKFKTGRSVRFIELPAGTYEWKEVDLGEVAPYGTSLIEFYVTTKNKYKKDFTFTIKPGVTNYPGDFVVNARNPGWDIFYSGRVARFLNRYGDDYYLQLTDRDAMLQQTLTPPQKQMIKRLGMAYVGPGKDTFPAFYRSLSAQQGGAK